MRVTRRTSRAAACHLIGCLAVSGCSGQQSTVDPAGPGARDAALLFWVMTVAGTAILIVVLVLLLYSVLRHPDRRRRVEPVRLVLAGGVVLPIVSLSALLLFSMDKGASTYAQVTDGGHRVRIVARQWWWELEYRDPDDRLSFTAANELRIPAGEPVELLLTSRDVIHSLWVPRLAGKVDLIPGRRNRLVIKADQPGTYRAQCAEYCGLAHAQMSLYVVALSSDDYRQWYERQRMEAAEPVGELAEAGARAFATRGCILCHTVRGHAAWGREGPDLTHVGGRKTIGAGVLTSTPEHFARWIAWNHQIKPGNRMPSYADLDHGVRLAIGTYLAGLK